MELCKPQPVSSSTNFLSSSSNTKQLYPPAEPNHLSFNPSLPHRHSSLSLSHQGLQSYKYSSIRSTKSDDTSNESKHDSFENFEDKEPYEVNEYGKNIPNENITHEPRSVEHDERIDEDNEEGSLLEMKNKISEFIDKLNLKITNIFTDMQFDLADSYSIALYGSSAAAALYLANAVLGAVDSIPLFPKLMEVVGLGYSIWFTNRYLLFKKNRVELAAKIEELKHQILGPDDE